MARWRDGITPEEKGRGMKARTVLVCRCGIMAACLAGWVILVRRWGVMGVEQPGLFDWLSGPVRVLCGVGGRLASAGVVPLAALVLAPLAAG
ncbi:hypothetical protein JW905_18380, partial [bacterium]|nr:hypothetical protein [candidate division CSSED10-310 bacterium]